MLILCKFSSQFTTVLLYKKLLSTRKFKTTRLTGILTTVEPIATPAAVEAICPNSPGCLDCCGAGCATLEAGLAAGTLETGLGGARVGGDAFPNIGDERPLDLLPPRGIVTVFLYRDKQR